MKRILGIVSSQRKLANGEILIKQAASSCGEPYQLELLRLTDLKIEPCRGCYACLIPGKQCPVQDDLYFLVEKMVEADGIIWATPCYVLGPAAITKLLADRTIAMAQRIDDFRDKPCVIIGTAGINGWEGYTLSALISFARLLSFNVKDAQMFLGALPGEALQAEGSEDRIAKLGKALFGEASKVEEGRCPTCGSDLWKFPEPDLALCPFCGQKAHLVRSNPDNSNPAIVSWLFSEPGRRFEFEQLKGHFQGWLREKAEEYKERRKELAKLRNAYKSEDTWLKP